MKIEVKNFDLKSTLLSGECFRVRELDDGSFINVLTDRVIKVKQQGNAIIVHSNNNYNLEKVVKEYFDLNRDYNKIHNIIISRNPQLKSIINKCKGYKILNQNSFEMCISYIISQNNNVKKICSSIEKLSVKYGEKIMFENEEYYLFPKYEDIKNISSEELRSLGIGFRDKYIKDFLEKYENLKDINTLSTEEALDELMSIKGIGLKVSSCILLFAYKRFDTFPIDTWAKKFISENYNIKNDQSTIEKFARDNFDKYSGLVIQYMFHSQRNINANSFYLKSK